MFIAAWVLSSFWALFFVPGQNLKFPHQNLAPGSPRSNDLAAPRLEAPPLLLRSPYRRAFCAGIRLAARGGGRCAPTGPECCPPKSDPRSARATWPPAVGWSGPWSEPDSDLRRSPESRGVRCQPAVPSPSHRPAARPRGPGGRADCVDCRRRGPEPGRETIGEPACRGL